MRKREIVIMAIAISSLLLLSYVNGLVLHTEQRDLVSYLIPAMVGAGLGLLLLAFLRAEEQQRQQERENFFDMARVLAEALGEKDIYTQGHSRRVTEYALMLGRRLELPAPQLDILRLAALLHDIGKIGVPGKILRQQEPLCADDWLCIRKHPDSSANILRDLQGEEAAMIRRAIRHHHEKWDGSGYPDGLVGEEIPLLARIISLADTFDAITTDRPYRRGKSSAEAMAEIQKGCGSQFDPHLCHVFRDMLTEKGL